MNQGKRCGLVWLYYPFPRVICSISFLALAYAYTHLLLCTMKKNDQKYIFFSIKNVKFLLKNKLKFMTLLGAVLSLGYFIEIETSTFSLQSHFWLCPFPLNWRRQSLLERPQYMWQFWVNSRISQSICPNCQSATYYNKSEKSPCISTPQNSKLLHLTVQPDISDWKPITLAN